MLDLVLAQFELNSPCLYQFSNHCVSSRFGASLLSYSARLNGSMLIFVRLCYVLVVFSFSSSNCPVSQLLSIGYILNFDACTVWLFSIIAKSEHALFPVCLMSNCSILIYDACTAC